MKITILQPQLIQEFGSRANQEDSIYPQTGDATQEERLFVLCDGMGGHENGEVASQLVCEVLPAYVKAHWEKGVFTDELLQQALDEVYNRINEYQSDSIRKMGTTLTCLCLHQGGVMMAHIGDSRIYHIRPSEHLILYKSRDHSLAYDLFMAGSISYEELTTYKKNVITRAVMPGLDSPFQADIAHSADVKTGDYFLLCSDGMLEQMTDGELLALLSADMDNEQKRTVFVERTRENKDNHSAILVQVEHVEPEADDDQLADDEQTTVSNAKLFEKKLYKQSMPTNDFSVKMVYYLKYILILLALVLLFVCLYVVISS